MRVPPQYGWLKDQFQSPFPATPEHPYLIHLEDAHADPVAQKNMAEVLDTLAREQKIDLVFVEAAIGSLDAKYLAFTGDAPLDRKIAAKLAEMGQMTAADLYLLEHGNAPLEFVGIENPDLYREEIRCLREVLGHEAEIKAWASQQGRVLDRKISRETGKDLASLLNFYLHLEQENGRVLQQLPSLNQQSRRLLGRDLTAFLEQRHFPALFRLLRLQKEKAVDMEKAKREWKQIQRMAYGVQRTALNKITENIEGWFFHRTPYSVRRTLGNPRFVLEKLYVSLQPKGFRFEQYPNFTRYARNLTLQYELRDANLFKELNQWLAQLITAAAKTDAEKALVHEVREAKLVHKLALLELTREEWEEIQSSVVGRESSVGLLTTDDPRLTTAFQFYRLVERRDQAFIENIRRELTARKKFRAVVIAGGFHTAAFTDFARKSDSSYTVIAPRAGSPSRQHYVNAILARHPEPAAASGAALIAQAISDPQLVRLGESPSFRAAQRRALGASLGGRTNERRPARAGVNRSRATLRKGNGDDFKRGLLSAEEKEYQEWLQKEWGRTGIAAAATLRDAMIERLIRATEPIVDEWQQSGWLEAQEAEAVMARSQFQGAAVLFRRIWEWKAVYEARGVEEGVIQSCFSLLIDPGQYQKGEELFGVSGIKLINYLRRANSQRKLKVAEEILQENKEGNRIFNASQAVAIATSRDAEAAKSAALELVKVEVNGKTVFNASQAVKIAISRDAEAARRVAQDMISERAANGQLLLSPAAISVIAAASKEIRTELQREALRAARAGQSVWPVIQGRTNISEAMADQDMPVEATEDGAEAQAESLGESPSFRAAQRRALAGSLGTPLDSTDPNLLGRLALYYSYLNQYNALNTKLAGVRGLRQIAIDHPERASEVMRRLFDAFGDSMEEMKRAAMEAVAKIGRTHQAAALEAMGYLFDRLSRNLLIPPNGQHNGSLVATAHPAHHVPAIEGTGIVIELAIAQPHTAATAVEYYADWLTHGNDIVRANGVHAIRVMSRLGAPNGEVARAAMRHLSSRFTDRDPWVRLAAVEGISEMGVAHRDLALEAMQYLFPMLWNEYQEHHGEHQYVRNGAAIGIDRLFMLTPDLTEQVRSLVLGLIATQDDLAKVNDDETRLIVRCIKKDPKIVNDEMKRRILALLDEDVNSDFVSAACDALFDVDSSFVTEAYLLRYLDYVAREPERVHKPATLRMPRPTTELLKKMALKRPNVFTGEVLAEWLKRTPTRNSEDLYWQKPEIIRIFNSVAPVLEDDAVMEELMQSEKTNQVFRQCWAAPGHDHRHTPAPLPITAVSVKKAGEYLAHKDPEVRRRAVEFLGVAAKRPETYTLFTPDNLKLLAERMRAHREEFQDTPLWKAYGAFFENVLEAEKMGRSFLAELLQRLVLVPFSIMADIAVVFREAKERERERRRQERNKPLTGPKGELRLQALAGDQGLFEVGRIAPILTEDILKRISSRPTLMTELSAQELLRRVAKVREMVEAAGLDLSPDELVFAADRVCLDEKNPETIYLDPLDKELNLAVRTPREETYARLRTRLEAMKADESDPASDLAGLGKLKAASASKRWGIENDASIMEQALRLTRLAGEDRFETDEGLAAEIVEMAKAEVTREAVPFRARWKSIRASGILDDDTFTEALELETDLATAQDPVSLDARINNIRLVLEEGKRAGKELEPEAVLEGASLIGNGDTVNERAKRSKLRRMWKVEKAGEMGETWKGKFAAWFRKTVEPAGMLTGLLHGEPRSLWPEESVDEASPIVPAPSIILDQELTGTVEEAFFPDATDMEADVRIWGHTLVGIKESAGKYFLVYYFDGAEAAGRPEYIFLDHFRDLADLNPVNLIQDSAAIEALLPELRRQKGEEAPQEVAPPSAPGGAAPSETRAPPEGAQAGDISAASASLESPTPANNRPAPAPAPAVPSAMSQPDELVAPGEVFEAESLGAQLDRVEVVGEEKIAQKTRDELKQHFQSSNVYDGIQRVIASRAGTQVILTFINERSEEATLSIELTAKSGWPAVVAEIDTKFAQAKESGQFKKPGAKKRIATWSYLLPLIGVAIIVALFLISGPKEKVEIPVLKPPPPVQKVVQPQIQEVTREWILATYPIIPPQPISEAEKAHAALRPDQMTASQLKEAATYEKAVNVLKQIKEKEGVLNWFGRIRRENVQFGNKMLVPAEVERIIWNDVVQKGYVSGQSLGRKSKKENDKLRTKRKVKAHLASDEEEAASQPKQTDSDPIKREGIFQYKRLLSVVAILPLVFIVGVIFVFVRKKQLRELLSPVVTQKGPAVKEPAAQNNPLYPDLTGHHRILLWQHGDEVADLDAAIPYVQEMIQESGRDARGRPQMAYILEYVCNMVEILDRYAKQYPERAAWFSYQDNGHVDEVALAKESEKLAGLLQDPDLVPIYNQFVDERAFAIETGFYEENPDVLKYAHRLGPRGVQTFQFILKNRFYVQVERTPFRSWATLMYFILNLNRRDTGNDFFTLARHARASNIFYFRGLWGRDRKMNSDLASALRTHKAPSLNSVYLVGYDHDPALIFKNYPHTSFRNIHQGGTALELKRRFGPFEDPSDGSLPNFNAEYDWLFHQDISPEESELLAQFLFEQDFRGAQTSARTAEEIFFRFLAKMKERKLSAMMLLNRYLAQLARDQQSALESFGMPLNRRDYILNALKRDGLLTAEEFAAIAQQNPAAYGHSLGVWVDWAASFWKARRRTILWMTLPLVMLASILAWSLFGSRPPPAPAASAPAASTSAYYYVPLNTKEDVIHHLTGLTRLLPPEANRESIREYLGLLADPAVGHVDLTDIAPEDLFAPGNEQYAMEAGILGTRTDAEGKASWIHYYANKLRLFPPEFLAGILWHEAQHLEDY
ncbi:MAG: hypothetical protein HY586_08190, partial [Candidatus Omnitrophica bacterium]|nr:hypothetical protein [Candidatus Omnitrophota bacterium]